MLRATIKHIAIPLKGVWVLRGERARPTRERVPRAIMHNRNTAAPSGKISGMKAERPRLLRCLFARLLARHRCPLLGLNSPLNPLHATLSLLLFPARTSTLASPINLPSFMSRALVAELNNLLCGISSWLTAAVRTVPDVIGHKGENGLWQVISQLSEATGWFERSGSA